MQMGLRDQLPKSTNEVRRLEEWIAAQTNADEWLEVVMDSASFSAPAIKGLLAKYGYHTKNDTIYRYRAKHGTR